MKKVENVLYAYTVRADYEGFILERAIMSKNQYNAVIDFLDAVKELFDYSDCDDFKDDIHILTVTQEVQE
ncbi:Uncharacterised protein [Streptococcus pseudoporcinus]|uniref:Uncharacterized protein n=1 Tax=Streptococcus pseudoporcinus TaxID=361101 RepID=A0A4U9XZT1_9STRE|nr:hypothetical protein [Streptococcus pseudoporcinus]QBX18703.1 hypothetical protein Javan443_0029 [Streptococcus phage Javan443]QBX18778.1 hypothetical protein Javan445_0038 [Streptococcus phage Javan445]VTS19690.1 Uncharacterised protein [Streptococcus pseudoporcinus]VUC69705.1 Uncharacterised protein [Streptococcus pseudoporcinus]VUC99997.1 Uncharacterised protein [Streptococcus pseudoporcinus]